MYQNKFIILLSFLARKDVFCALLIWLICILGMGTVAQKDIGLYASQIMYFSSMIILIGGVFPMPGGQLTLILVFLGLLSKLLTDKWSIKRLGSIVLHGGGILLLLGGFITMHFSVEGNMIIYEGENSNYITQDTNLEFILIKINSPDVSPIVFDEKLFKNGRILKSKLIPFSIKIKKFCKNCKVSYCKTIPKDYTKISEVSCFKIEKIPLAIENEKNRAGLQIEIFIKNEKIKSYAIYEFMAQPQYLEYKDKKYQLLIQRAQTRIPFYIHLVKFTRELYPGTDIPQKYESKIIVKDGEIKWNSKIEMNKPLRYKKYVFYQASFIEEKTRNVSVLAVVKNSGQIFPYISSIIMCIGLLIHLSQRLPGLFKKNTNLL